MGILDTFPFFLATQKRQSHYAKAIVAGFPSFFFPSFCSGIPQWVEIPRRAESRCHPQPKATWATEGPAWWHPIREEFLILAQTGVQFLAMKYHILLF